MRAANPHSGPIPTQPGDETGRPWHHQGESARPEPLGQAPRDRPELADLRRLIEIGDQHSDRLGPVAALEPEQRIDGAGVGDERSDSVDRVGRHHHEATTLEGVEHLQPRVGVIESGHGVRSYRERRSGGT